MTSAIDINTNSFYPRNYEPDFLLVKKGMDEYPLLKEFLVKPVTGGSTPPAHLFKEKGRGVPFLKTSAIGRHIINLNDLYYIDHEFHKKTIKRTITKPYDVIYSMTGKFMGKAALCPPVLEELNMSQNSVLLRTESELKSAFLTIFLNSDINRIQVKGAYSITKQKFLNQGKIKNLKIPVYKKQYEPALSDYIDGINCYYNAIKNIEFIINQFKENYLSLLSNTALYGFTINSATLDKCLLLPNHYRPDVATAIGNILQGNQSLQFDMENIRKGNEIGSENYIDEGYPFIKTSDIMNFDVDYEPNYYCSPALAAQTSQDIKKGDIIFTKDGKLGEIAIIQDNANIVISSGLVKYRPRNQDELYWVFLLLSSDYGKAYFTKWFVIASTMVHLRKEFFTDFKIPGITPEIKRKYLNPLKDSFAQKEKAYIKITKSRDTVITKIIES